MLKSLSIPMPSVRAMRRAWLVETALLISFIAAFGLVSCWLGVDANWDDRNYHQYNGYAALHGRYATDLVPAQLQTFIHPGQDVLLYLLRRALNHHPWAFSFVWAIPNGVVALLTFHIALLLQPNRSGWPISRAACAVLALIIGITGGAGFPSIGTSMSEMLAGCFIAGALLLLLQNLGGNLGIARPTLAGVFLGIAIGIKLVEVTYFLGVLLGLLAFVRWWSDVKPIIAFGLAAAATVLVTVGPWSIHLYSMYGNPLFPYFNNIFHSPYAAFMDYSDVGGRPHDLYQAVFFPLYWTFEQTLQIGGNYVRDARFAIFYVCVLILAFEWVVRWMGRGILLNRADRRLGFFCIFFTSTFLFWERQFSILRYLSVLEIFGGALLFGALLRFRALERNAVALFTVLSVIMAGLWATTIYPDWGRVQSATKLEDVVLPPMAEGAVVIFLTNFPMGYIAAHGQKNIRFIAGQNNFVYPWDKDAIETEAAQIIAGQHGEIWSLEPAREPSSPADRTLAIFKLERESCAPVHSNLDQDAIKICRLRRVETPPVT